MNRSGQVLAFLCFAAASGLVTAAGAAEDAVLAQELRNVRASDRVASAVWTRRPDSYTLQVVSSRSPCERLIYERQQASRVAPAPTVPPATADVDPSSFFIGSAIANLRGLDPSLGGCTLTLTDGRRPAQPASAAPITSAPAAAPKPTPVVAEPVAPAVIQVWLLKADGSQVQPSAVSSLSPADQGCGARCLTNEVLYRFPLVVGAEAAAVAISVDGQFYIEKLQSLESR